MADRYWVNDAADNNWSNATNWAISSGGAGGAGVPAATDDVYFDTGSGANNCQCTAASVCKSLTADSNYSGNFDLNGQTLTISGSASFNNNGTGNLTIDGALTLDADGSITITNNWNSHTLTGALDVQGTGNIAISPAYAGNITIGANTKTSTLTQHLQITNKVVTMGAGAVALSGFYILLNCTTETTPLVLNASTTLTGSSISYIIFRAKNTAAPLSINVPAGDYGSVNVQLEDHTTRSQAATLNLQGNITTTRTLYMNGYSAQTITINTNNHNIDTNRLQYGSLGAANILNINFGSSVVDVDENVNSTTWNTGTTNVDLSTSNWTCAADYDLGSNTSITPGTSQITFDGTAACTLTSAGESFYDIILNKSSNGITLQDALSCHDLDINNGNFDTNGQTVTYSGDFTWDADDTLTLDSTVTGSGDGDFHIANSGTVNIGSMALNLQGTGNLDIDMADKPYTSLTCGATGKVTTQTGSGGGSGVPYTGPYSLTIGAGTFTVNSAFYVNCTSATTITIHASATINGSNIFYYLGGQDATNVNIPASTYGCQLRCSLGNSNTGGLTLTGNVSCTGSEVRINKASTSACTFDVNDNDFSVTNSLLFGNSNATNNLTFNCGTGNITVGNLETTTFNTGTTLFNMESSSWTCNGDWDFGTNTTLNAGTSSINFAGTTACTLTSASETFYDIQSTKTANGITLQDALACRNLDLDDGNFDFNGQTVALSGSFAWDSADTLTYDAAMTMTGDANFSIANTGTVNVTSSLDHQGTGDINITKANTKFTNLTVGATGKTITWTGGAIGIGLSSVLTVGAGAFTINVALYHYFTTEANPLVIDASATIDGTSDYYFAYNGTGTDTTNVPAFDMNGVDVTISKENSGTITFNQAGNIESNKILIYGNDTNNSMTYNTADNNITTASTFELGMKSVGTATFNMGASTISVGADFDQGSNYDIGTTNLNLQTSQWTVATSWTYGSNIVVDIGTTATITFTGASSISPASKGFPQTEIQGNYSITSTATWDRLILTSNPTVTMGAGNTQTVSANTDTDWDGATLVSSNPGNQWLLVNPAGMTVRNMTITDSDASGGNNIIAYTTLGNTDGGNNSAEWIFLAPAVGGVEDSDLAIRITMGLY